MKYILLISNLDDLYKKYKDKQFFKSRGEVLIALFMINILNFYFYNYYKQNII